MKNDYKRLMPLEKTKTRIPSISNFVTYDNF